MFPLDTISKILHKTKGTIKYSIENNLEAVRFLILFLFLSFFFFILYFFLQDNLKFMLIVTASLTGYISNLTGLTVSVDGVFLSLGVMDFEIIHECTGIFAIMITSSSILAYPTQLKQKIIGILFIIPLILCLNLLRLLVLIYIGKYHMDLFEIFHSYLWQGTFIIFIILSWFLWIELVVNH